MWTRFAGENLSTVTRLGAVVAVLADYNSCISLHIVSPALILIKRIVIASALKFHFYTRIFERQRYTTLPDHRKQYFIVKTCPRSRRWSQCTGVDVHQIRTAVRKQNHSVIRSTADERTTV
jgi:hypothetical protein